MDDQYRETDDLTKLEEITLDNVLECLVQRYLDSRFYTFAGSVLISLNPCFKIKTYYQKSIETQFDVVNNHDKETKLPPHVYSIGRKCLQNLLINGNNQIVVVSGDSGAGKTTATQQLLCYFIEKNPNPETFPTLNTSHSNVLEEKIYYATYILECFGNATTIANPNSSRFGRLLQLNYRNNSVGVKTIIGAQIQTCLLEKQRVSKCERNERNFHIFYYVLVALKKGIFQLESKSIQPVSFWLKMIPSHFIDNLRESDEEDFNSFWKSICALELQEEFLHVFKIIYGVMVLLKIDFIPTSSQFHSNTNLCSVDENDEINPDDMERLKKEGLGDNEEKENIPNRESPCFNYQNPYFAFGQRKQSFVVANDESFDVLENIFQVDIYSLMDSLLARNITAGRRKSTVRKPIETIKEIQERRNALVTTIYDALFNFILNRLNSLLDASIDLAESGSNSKSSMLNAEENMEIRKISLLDLYGFENLESNHLEQLCINYANERLQQVNISHLKCFMSQFSSPLHLEISEPKEINRVQREISFRLDALHSTLFSVLDEVCMLNRSQTDEQVFSSLTESIKSNDFIKRVRKSHDENCAFVIKHYASQVEYNFKGMVDKNRDYIPLEFHDILQSSSSSIINTMFPLEKVANDNKTTTTTNKKMSGIGNTGNIQSKKLQNVKSKREKTVLQRFKVSVESLVNQLDVKNNENQDVQFIRCIRPNNNLIQGRIDRELVKKQLYACGIEDVIRISGNGFPIRIPTAKFFMKFRKIILRCFYGIDKKSESIKTTTGAATSGGVTKIVDFDQDKFRDIFNLNKSDLRFGVSQVFLTEATYKFFTHLDELIWRRIVIHCQRSWRAIKRYRAEKESEERSRQLYLEEMLKLSLRSPNDDIQQTTKQICNDDNNDQLIDSDDIKSFTNPIEFQTPTSTTSISRNNITFRRGRRVTSQISDPLPSRCKYNSSSIITSSNIETILEKETEKLPPVKNLDKIHHQPSTKSSINHNIRPLSSESNNSISNSTIFLNSIIKSKKVIDESGDHLRNQQQQQCNLNSLINLIFLDPNKLYSPTIIMDNKQNNSHNNNNGRRTSLLKGGGYVSPSSPFSQSFSSHKSSLDSPSSSSRNNLRMLCHFDLFVDTNQSIVSKRQIYKGPIKFYTKPTALPNNHVIPNRLRPQGLLDLLN